MILQYHQGVHLYLVLEQVLGVPVGEGDEPGGDEGDGGEERRRGDRLHRVDAPEQPHRDGRHDERVAVKQRRRLQSWRKGIGIVHLRLILHWNMLDTDSISNDFNVQQDGSFVSNTLVLTFLEKSWSRSSSSLLKPFLPTAIATSTRISGGSWSWTR